MKLRTCPNGKRQGLIVMVVLTMVLGALVLVAGDGWAQARKTTISCSENSQTGDVTVDFKISGVGNGNLCVTSATTYTARCICKSNSGNCPAASNKRTTAFPASDSAIVESRNGQISGEETLEAPSDADCQAALSCPSGQTAILAQTVVGKISVNVFDEFDTNLDGSCTGTDTAIRSGSCTPSPTKITFNQQCASRF